MSWSTREVRKEQGLKLEPLAALVGDMWGVWWGGGWQVKGAHPGRKAPHVLHVIVTRLVCASFFCIRISVHHLVK